MKKVFLIIGLSLIGCKKENPEPKAQEVCNCGIVQSDDVEDYSVVIRNSCSGNNKKFFLSEGDWMNAHPGTTYCINNVTSW
jgi:hypothetical protein